MDTLTKERVEAYTRLSMINAILCLYEVGELTKNGQKFKKQVRNGMKKAYFLLDKDLQKKIIEKVNKIWEDTFNEFLHEKILAHTFITGLYKDELFKKYGVNENVFFKYLLGCGKDDHEEVEIFTYKVEDFMNTKIEQLIKELDENNVKIGIDIMNMSKEEFKHHEIMYDDCEQEK